MTHEYKWLEKQVFFFCFFFPLLKDSSYEQSRKDRRRIESCEPQVLILLLLVSALCIYSRVPCIKLAVASTESQYFIWTESSGALADAFALFLYFPAVVPHPLLSEYREDTSTLFVKYLVGLLQQPPRTTLKGTRTAFCNIMFLFSF